MDYSDTFSRTSTADDTLENFEKTIEWCLKNRNRNLFFAALYRTVTLKVHHAISAGLFEDNERMSRFVQHFSNYYFEAFRLYTKGELKESNPWYKVFSEGTKKKILVQHMLLGVNAHINYDLANTCNAISPGSNIISLVNDFVTINNILSSTVEELKIKVYSISPLLYLASRFTRKFESDILNFSINTARSKSWETACQLAISDGEKLEEVESSSLLMTQKIANRIINPGKFASILVYFISLSEFNSFSQKFIKIS